jgi:hypothetical protein
MQRGSWRERPTASLLLLLLSLSAAVAEGEGAFVAAPGAEYSDDSLANVAVRKADVHSARGLRAWRKGAMKDLKSERWRWWGTVMSWGRVSEVGRWGGGGGRGWTYRGGTLLI